MHFCHEKKSNTTELKLMIYNTSPNLTNFLQFYCRRNLLVPGKDKLYLANFP